MSSLNAKIKKLFQMNSNLFAAVFFLREQQERKVALIGSLVERLREYKIGKRFGGAGLFFFHKNL